MKHGNTIMWPDCAKGRINNPDGAERFTVLLDDGLSVVRTLVQLQIEGARLVCDEVGCHSFLRQPNGKCIRSNDRLSNKVRAAEVVELTDIKDRVNAFHQWLVDLEDESEAIRDDRRTIAHLHESQLALGRLATRLSRLTTIRFRDKGRGL